MGASWRTQEQEAFFDENLPSFVRSFEGGEVKEFWSKIVDQWFKRWPISTPPNDLVEKKGSAEEAAKAWKAKKVEVSMRTYK